MKSDLLFNVKRELQYAAKYLLRDNFLCDRYVKKLMGNERLSPEELQRRNAEFLLRTLRIASQRIPHYRHMQIDFGAEEVSQVLAERYPIITKEDLINHPYEFYPEGRKIWPWVINAQTGGTTGTPLSILWSLESVFVENAFINWHLSWSGYRDGMRRAALRGDLVVPANRRKPPYWYYNKYNRQLVLSSNHLSEETADFFVAQLQDFSPYLIQAYPSVAYELAVYMKERDKYLAVPYVFSQSEQVFRFQRQLIEERFQCRVMEGYGMSERVVFASECEQGNLHVSSDYSYVEIVDEQGRLTEEFGYVVGTTYHNRVMPLIRYKMSDITKWKKGVCECGRPYPMIEQIAGRLEDAIIGSRGVNIGPLLYRILKGVERTRQVQVAQIERNLLEIRVVPAAEYNSEDEQKLVQNLHQLVDSGMAAQVVVVSEIPRTRRGKHRWIVNEYIDGTMAR